MSHFDSPSTAVAQTWLRFLCLGVVPRHPCTHVECFMLAASMARIKQGSTADSTDSTDYAAVITYSRQKTVVAQSPSHTSQALQAALSAELKSSNLFKLLSNHHHCGTSKVPGVAGDSRTHQATQHYTRQSRRPIIRTD